MNIEEARVFCLSRPVTTEDFPFDETTLVIRVMGKMFAVFDLKDPERIVLKCNPEYALELRENTGLHEDLDRLSDNDLGPAVFITA